MESYAIRIEHGGRSLTYSGDTGVCAELGRLAEGVDLFLCEASFTHGKEDIPDLHLNGREAGEYAHGGSVGRLVLTHIPPWTDPAQNLADARAVYDGPVDLAYAGAVYEV